MQHAAVATSSQGTACNAQAAESPSVTRLLCPCSCDQQPGFRTSLQLRRGKWDDRSAVYKIWDLMRCADGIHELFHEIKILTHLQSLQVMILSICSTGLR